MLNESKIYSFIDNKLGFSIHFLEGQKLLADLVTIHNLELNALNYYRGAVLSSAQMIQFLKPKENLGFYIDSERPYFRFKIEINNSGALRTLLLPEEFDNYPTHITGKIRITKIFSSGHEPYTSVTAVSEMKSSELINEILKTSYQTNSLVLMSDEVDASVMITKLPPLDVDSEINIQDDKSLTSYVQSLEGTLKNLYQKCYNDDENIINYFEQNGFSYLGSREIRFFCPCSKERMVQNLYSLSQNDLHELFRDESELEIRCDYCNTVYKINQSDLN